MWSSTSDKLNLGEVYPVEFPWYYRMVDWAPKMTINRENLTKDDYFVWSRDWKKYYDKRMEATWKDTIEGTWWKWKVNEVKNPTEEEVKESEELVDNSSSERLIW